MIHILRELANKAKLLNFNLIKCLLEKNNLLSEILFIGESQDDWVQTEIMPTHEYEENGAHIIHTTAHVRNGVNDIFCEIFFLENSEPRIGNDIYDSSASGLPKKTGEYIQTTVTD